MKFKRIIGMATFLLFTQSLAAMPALPEGGMSPLSSEVQPASKIGSELSSLPASIAQYNAATHRPDAEQSNDFDTYGGQLCQLPGFKCLHVSQNETWAKLFRNDYKREIVMRLNRTNVALRYRKWILVPKNWHKMTYMSLSPLPDHISPTGEKRVIVDLRVFAFGAYDENGDLVYWGPASGGKKYCSDTNEDCRSATGDFKIYRIQGENCTSSKYPVDQGGGAPMPYCMHYYRGYAIHGSTLAGFLNGSRGCIRLFYSDAKWLNEDFVHRGTEVVVKS